MHISTSIPETVQIRRGRLLALVGAVAVIVAVVTWALVSYAVNRGSQATQAIQPTSKPVFPSPMGATGYLQWIKARGGHHVVPAVSGSVRAPHWLMTLTPAELAALRTSYALPTAQTGPTVAQVLDSMSPQTRRYTEKTMALTFEQLAAGAAGSP